MSPPARPRFPWAATLVVLLAVAVMVRLGFWQLERLKWKEGLIARYEAAQSDPQTIPLAALPADNRYAYRHVQIHTQSVENWSDVAGRNAAGQVGWAAVARCDIIAGRGGAMIPVDVVAGWSRELGKPHDWNGGVVTGVMVPGGPLKAHLVADPPLAGLAPNAKPDPRDLPNNHFSYAVQWFLFAATALVIYGIALRKRLKGG